MEKIGNVFKFDSSDSFMSKSNYVVVQIGMKLYTGSAAKKRGEEESKTSLS